MRFFALSGEARLVDSPLAYGGSGSMRQGNDYLRSDDAGRLVSTGSTDALYALYTPIKQGLAQL